MKLHTAVFVTVLLGLLITVSACTVNQKVHIIDLQEELSCVQTFDITRSQQYIINSNTSYQRLNNMTTFSFSCKNFTLPGLDFSTYTLLGKSTEGRGCNATQGRSVVQNGSLLTYTIDVVTTGNCTSKVWTSTNWILVPKTTGKTVAFNVVEKHLDG